MARWQFPDASAEVERLRVENERLQSRLREMALDVLAADGQAQEAYEAQIAAEARADRLQAERDDLAARLQAIQQTERKYNAAKLTEADKMRKGQAI